MEIRRFVPRDEQALFAMLQEEGEEWVCYWGEEILQKYTIALNRSVTYVAFDGDTLCGYVRCRDDDGFGVYIYDLLVRKACRGNGYGKKLMERVCTDYPNDTVYVMSDVDGYYQKLGYRKEGSIFVVCTK